MQDQNPLLTYIFEADGREGSMGNLAMEAVLVCDEEKREKLHSNTYTTYLLLQATCERFNADISSTEYGADRSVEP